MFCTSSSSSALDCLYFSCASCGGNQTAMLKEEARGDAHLVLLLPLITLLLDTGDLPLKVLRLDIDLPQPESCHSGQSRAI